jgi:hypothetical protein
MPIILDLGEFWIDSLFVSQAAVPSGGTLDQAYTPTRVGRFCGGSAVIVNSVAGQDPSGPILLNASYGTLSYGVLIDTGRIVVRNSNQAPQDINVHIILFMRK